MIRVSSAELLELFPQQQDWPQLVIEGVKTDSREDASGALFVALRGERFDGHEYAAAAVDKGAVAVIEMGANHQQEIRHLVAIAEPDVVYVNNAGSAHVEGFGGPQGVIRGKGEMYQYAPSESLAVFNEDEDAVEYWRSIARSTSSMSFSLRQPSEVSASFSEQAGTLHIEVTYQRESADTEIQLQGWHNAQNATAAVTLALAAGMDFAAAVDALGGFHGVAGRQRRVDGKQGSTLIDDTYNANPDSLRAAIAVLCAQPGEHWLALGDMAELGEEAQQMHDDVVAHAHRSGVTEFFALGPLSCHASDAFGNKGYCFDSHEEMADFISPRLNKKINLLIKGSRSAGMEKLVAALRPHQQEGDPNAV